jgi:hypothetical protein
MVMAPMQSPMAGCLSIAHQDPLFFDFQEMARPLLLVLTLRDKKNSPFQNKRGCRLDNIFLL